MKKINSLLLGCSALLGLISIGFWVFGNGIKEIGPFLILMLVCLAIGGRDNPKLNQVTFIFWTLAVVTMGMFYPHYFQKVGNYKLNGLVVPLLQFIMFAMGTEMSLKDFEGVMKTPKAVLIGLACHFTIMPLVGVLIATYFGFPSEIAAGFILVGCVPSGVTSNVMAFIAKANLPLSIAIATISTLIAPIMTPLLMKILAGKLIEVDFMKMVLHVLEIIIVPVVLGLIVNKMIRKRGIKLQSIMPTLSMLGMLIIVTLIVSSGRDNLLTTGPFLFLACMIHHTLGYLFGYWSGRLFGMDEPTCRTISLEVGTQNSTLASVLAVQMGKVATVGLAAIISIPWITIEGTTLANWWRSRKI